VPPAAAAAEPAYATVVANEWGVGLEDVVVVVPGARVESRVALAYAQRLEARARLTLKETYLRTSPLLAVPRALAERVVVPVHVRGPAATPKVCVGVRETMRRVARDNRFVRGAPAEPPLELALPEVDVRAIEAELRRELS